MRIRLPKSVSVHQRAVTQTKCKFPREILHRQPGFPMAPMQQKSNDADQIHLQLCAQCRAQGGVGLSRKCTCRCCCFAAQQGTHNSCGGAHNGRQANKQQIGVMHGLQELLLRKRLCGMSFRGSMRAGQRGEGEMVCGTTMGKDTQARG